MRCGLSIDALRVDRLRRRPQAGLTVHAGCGNRYRSAEFQTVLIGYGVRNLLSRKGHCWDNVSTERRWKSPKVGRLHGRRFETRRVAMNEIADGLAFHSHRRFHASWGFVSPGAFDGQWFAAQQRQAA